MAADVHCNALERAVDSWELLVTVLVPDVIPFTAREL